LLLDVLYVLGRPARDVLIDVLQGKRRLVIVPTNPLTPTVLEARRRAVGQQEAASRARDVLRGDDAALDSH
jgi:hypothetical protein